MGRSGRRPFATAQLAATDTGSLAAGQIMPIGWRRIGFKIAGSRECIINDGAERKRGQHQFEHTHCSNHATVLLHAEKKCPK